MMVGVVGVVGHSIKNDIDTRQTHGYLDIQVDKATKSKTAEHKTGKKKTKIQEWKMWKTLTEVQRQAF